MCNCRPLTTFNHVFNNPELLSRPINGGGIKAPYLSGWLGYYIYLLQSCCASYGGNLQNRHIANNLMMSHYKGSLLACHM